MAGSYITKFIVDGADYFAAYTDEGEVRIGLINCASINIPSDHVRYAEAVACSNEDEVEALFDEMFTF